MEVGLGRTGVEGGFTFISLSGILSYVLRQNATQWNKCALCLSFFTSEKERVILTSSGCCKDYHGSIHIRSLDQSLAQSEHYINLLFRAHMQLREVIRHGRGTLAVKVQVTWRQTLGDVRRVKSNGHTSEMDLRPRQPRTMGRAGSPFHWRLSKEPRSLHTCLWIWARVFSALICSSGNSFYLFFLLKFSWLTVIEVYSEVIQSYILFIYSFSDYFPL